MKKYRVSKELKKYVRRVLIRSFYKYHFITDDGGQCWCVTNATSDAFHQIVQRAKCEKATEETGVFMVTAKERNNVKMLSSLLKQNGVTSYQVIDDADASRRLIK